MNLVRKTYRFKEIWIIFVEKKERKLYELVCTYSYLYTIQTKVQYYTKVIKNPNINYA